MRQLASILLIAFALPALATEAWRWKDESGVVHYSDRPVPGAVRVDLGPVIAPPENAAATAPPTFVRAEPPAEEFRYASCTVLTPGNDEVFHAVSKVDASLQISPGLRPAHRLQVLLDGTVYAGWSARAQSATLDGLFRGTHTLVVQVLDANGKLLCAGPAISFHIRQQSILSPTRQTPPKPAPGKP